MRRSSQAKGNDTFKRVQAWLAAGHPVPRRRGKVHRGALCRALGIVRSTLSSNPALRALVASLDAQEVVTPETLRSSRGGKGMVALERELIALREENADLRRQLRAVELLLRHDRCLR